jgi:hypothetical protein
MRVGPVAIVVRERERRMKRERIQRYTLLAQYVLLYIRCISSYIEFQHGTHCMLRLLSVVKAPATTHVHNIHRQSYVLSTH